MLEQCTISAQSPVYHQWAEIPLRLLFSLLSTQVQPVLVLLSVQMRAIPRAITARGSGYGYLHASYISAAITKQLFTAHTDANPALASSALYSCLNSTVGRQIRQHLLEANAVVAPQQMLQDLLQAIGINMRAMEMGQGLADHDR